MTDQAQGTEVKVDTSAAPETKEGLTRHPSEMGAEIFDEAKGPTADLGSLFGDEKRSTEAELRGEEKPPEEAPPKEKPPQDEKKEPATPESKGEEKKAEEKKGVEQKKEEGKEEEAKPGAPPKGFVPQQALTEARVQLKSLKEENAELKAALAEKPKEVIKAPESSEDAKWKDFKVLTDEEYEELVEDDPIEAQKYDRKQRSFEKYQEQKAKAAEESAKGVERVKSLISDAAKKIEEAVPGIYQKDSDIPSKLANFALEHGFDDETYLEIMTNPETLIIPKNSDKPYLMGPGALSLIKLLHTLQSKTPAPVNPDDLRKEIEKELEPKLREKITKQILSKMKGTDKDSAYRSLTEVPGSELAPEEASKTYTEEEWGRLPEEKRRQLLGA